MLLKEVKKDNKRWTTFVLCGYSNWLNRRWRRRNGIAFRFGAKIHRRGGPSGV